MALLLTGCTAQAAAETKPAFIFVTEDVKYIELGDHNYQFTNEDLFSSTSNNKYFEFAQVDYSQVNRDAIGSYPLNISFTEESNVNKAFIVDVVVRDTIAPTLETKDISIIEGDPIDVNSFVVSTTDLQTVELSFKEEVDLASVGTRSYTVVAKDASGNVTEKTVNLTVEAKPVVNNWTPSNNGGGSSWAPPANNGGGGTTPAPVAPTPTEAYDCAGDYNTCFEQARAACPPFKGFTIKGVMMSDGTRSNYYYRFMFG